MSTRVIENSPVPVIAIPEISGIDDPSHIHNVLYLTRFDESDLCCHRKTYEFPGAFPAPVLLLYMLKQRKTRWLEEVQMNRLRDHFRERYNKMEVHCES